TVPAVVLLANALGLSRFEQDVLLLSAAAEFDDSFCALFARAQGDASRTHATFALALSIFDDAAWDALSPERPLRYWKLIEINQRGAQALTTSALRADERIVNYLKGLNYLDDRLAPYLTVVQLADVSGPVAASQLQLRRTITAQWREAPAHALAPVVQLVGTDSVGKQMIAACAAADIRRPIYRPAPDALPMQPADLQVLAPLVHTRTLPLP